MSCTYDFRTFASDAERAKFVFRAAKKWGIAPDVVKALVTLSQGEVGYNWLVKRPNMPANAPNCCALMVGMEQAYLRGLLVSGAAPKTIKFLQDKGWLAGTDNGPAFAGGLGPNTDKNAEAFEFTVSVREEAALVLYSLGPTQLSLKQHYKKVCGDAQNWEELWDLYVAGSQIMIPSTVPDAEVELWIAQAKVAYTISRWLRFYVPKRYQPEGCIAQDGPIGGDTREPTVAWLTRQAGNAATAGFIYDGNPDQTAQYPWLAARPKWVVTWPKVNQWYNEEV